MNQVTTNGVTDVAVNLLFCTPGRVGGSEEYLVRQLAGLAAVTNTVENRVDVTLYASDAFFAAHGDVPGRRRPSPVPTARRPLRVALEHTWLAANTRRADVVHHGGGTVPRVGRQPTVLTLHDLQFLRFPEYVAPTKLRYLRWMVPRSVARATIVAAPSEYVRDTVVDAYGADPSRVVVVPHGVADPDRAAMPDAAAVRARYGLGDGPVLVYPAMTHPHKNHTILLEAMATRWSDPALRLVLLGGPGAADAEVTSRIEQLGLGSRVVRPGRVSDLDRDALIALADALVFPSRYEGFGAPLVEAMALGTPIVCADHPAITDVVRDAAVVLPPDDVDAWGAALDEVRRRRDELVAAGRRRREAFTLDASGRALAAAYEAAVA
jgi:glycosyltransferase involved in cell wall biosynthesis